MNIWNFIQDKISQSYTVYLMVVTESIGSSPGKQGFKMAVCSDNSLMGSIGGGVMEYNLVEECKKLLSEKKLVYFSRDQVHNGDKKGSTGMMCSGKQTITFVPLSSNDLDLITNIISCINENKTGILELNKNGFDFAFTDDLLDAQYTFFTKEDSWTYKEVIGLKNTISIIGAGHVGYSVSRIFSQLGFIVNIFDNRKDLEMLVSNPFASKKLVVDYTNIDKYVMEGKNSFAVIMTNNHQHDVDVLESLLSKNLGYIGLMGSKTKVEKFKTILLGKGFPEADINKVYAPIGLNINSITPDEIAISIAAEVIKVKNSKL